MQKLRILFFFLTVVGDYGRAEEYGLADQGYSTQASFFDSDLYLFVINHSCKSIKPGRRNTLN